MNPINDHCTDPDYQGAYEPTCDCEDCRLTWEAANEPVTDEQWEAHAKYSDMLDDRGA